MKWDAATPRNSAAAFSEQAYPPAFTHTNTDRQIQQNNQYTYEWRCQLDCTSSKENSHGPSRSCEHRTSKHKSVTQQRTIDAKLNNSVTAVSTFHFTNAGIKERQAVRISAMQQAG